jgi:hypothetical protein
VHVQLGSWIGQPALSDLLVATELAVASVGQLLILLVPRNLRRPTSESQTAIDRRWQNSHDGSVLDNQEIGHRPHGGDAE